MNIFFWQMMIFLRLGQKLKIFFLHSKNQWQDIILFDFLLLFDLLNLFSLSKEKEKKVIEKIELIFK